jgi:hypothetical protein
MEKRVFLKLPGKTFISEKARSEYFDRVEKAQNLKIDPSSIDIEPYLKDDDLYIDSNEIISFKRAGKYVDILLAGDPEYTRIYMPFEEFLRYSEFVVKVNQESLSSENIEKYLNEVYNNTDDNKEV